VSRRAPASRLQLMSGEGALAVFSRARELEAAGKSIIHLELGEPDFHPAAEVVEAAKSALDRGQDRYCPVAGVPALRQAVAAYLRRTRRIEVAPEQVVIFPGCKMALFSAMMSLVEPGDEVLYPDPGFPAYPSVTRALGGTPVAYCLAESAQLQPDPLEIGRKITPRTKALITNSPNNPTGAVSSDAVQRRMAELAVEHDLLVLSDEIYARFVYNDEFRSMLAYPGMAGRTFIIDGFSKSFAMTGWRLGYVVAPARFVPGLEMLIVNTFTCAAEFTQYAAVEALREARQMTAGMVEQFAARRARFIAGLNRIAGFRCRPPQGAFYAWVNVAGTGCTAEEVCRVMLEEAGVAAIPGAAFGAAGREFVRFSFASAMEVLDEAVARIATASRLWQKNAPAELAGRHS
jgi:aspartate aminotransferase